MDFSLRPPIGSTRPRKVISPVIATSRRTGRSLKAEAKAQAAQERYLEVKKEQIKVDEEHAALMEKMNGFEKEWQALNNITPKAVGEHNKAMKEMEEQLVSLK